MLARAATAIALFAAFLAALAFLDARAFGALVGAILAAAAWEWARLAGLGAAAATAYAAGAAALWLASMFAPAPARDVVIALGAGFWVAVAPVWLARGFPPRAQGARLALGPVALFPAGMAMLALDRGALLALLGLVWIADTAAYACGRIFGRSKLAPSISPGKTWEGALGAAAACALYAIILAMSLPGLRAQVHGGIWVLYLGGAVYLCALGIVGDLLESALKRSAGAKDSGTVLPGHGGVLDRIDSASAVLPVGAVLIRQAVAP